MIEKMPRRDLFQCDSFHNVLVLNKKILNDGECSPSPVEHAQTLYSTILKEMTWPIQVRKLPKKYGIFRKFKAIRYKRNNGLTEKDDAKSLFY